MQSRNEMLNTTVSRWKGKFYSRPWKGRRIASALVGGQGRRTKLVLGNIF